MKFRTLNKSEARAIAGGGRRLMLAKDSFSLTLALDSSEAVLAKRPLPESAPTGVPSYGAAKATAGIAQVPWNRTGFG